MSTVASARELLEPRFSRYEDWGQNLDGRRYSITWKTFLHFSTHLHLPTSAASLLVVGESYQIRARGRCSGTSDQPVRRRLLRSAVKLCDRTWDPHYRPPPPVHNQLAPNDLAKRDKSSDQGRPGPWNRRCCRRRHLNHRHSSGLIQVGFRPFPVRPNQSESCIA